MKYVFLFVVLLCMVSSVLAMDFSEDIVFNQGGINYIFKEGVSVVDFELSLNGIEIDNYKLFLSIQGGILNVTIYEWGGIDNHLVGFKSSVPQDVNFRLFEGGNSYYFYNGKSYSIGSLKMGVDEVNGSFVYLGNDDSESIITISKLNWYEQKIVEFEIEQSELDDGRVIGKNFAVTYVGFVFFVVFFVVVILVLRRFGK